MAKYLLIELKVAESVPTGSRAFLPLPKNRRELEAALPNWQTVIGALITEELGRDPQIEAIVKT